MTKIFYLDAVTGKATLARAIMLCNGAVVQPHNLYNLQYTTFKVYGQDMSVKPISNTK